jgi:MoaA/NifB/PqqE/SkfB family radical SAM enzyme
MTYLKYSQPQNVNDVISTLKTIEINVIDSCNRACNFCPQSDLLYNFKRDKINEKIVIEISKQLKNKKFKGRISITGFGEPLLHKELERFIKIFRNDNPCCFIELITNGDALTTLLIKNLYAAGISRISVSVYEEDKVEHFTTLFKDYNESLFLLRKRFLQVSYVNRIEIFNGVSEGQKRPCFLPSYKMIINHTGEVLLCCNDWTRENVFDNIFSQNLFDIWINNMQEKRIELLCGIRNGVCKHCNINGTLHGKDSADFFLNTETK